jgi:hypothetical protein
MASSVAANRRDELAVGELVGGRVLVTPATMFHEGAFRRSRIRSMTSPRPSAAFSSTRAAQRPFRKGPEMARKTPPETNAAAQRRLTEAMLSLGHSIDKQRTGPKRLQMLRDQASLSDKRELLRSSRM